MKYRHFTIEERERIQELWWERRSVRVIACILGRSPSSVSRELRRNFPLQHQVYTPRLAHERALSHRHFRGRTDRLKNIQIREYVISHLVRRWSPEQIAGCIFEETGECISHEAIYQFIYAQIQGQEGKGSPYSGKQDWRYCLRRRKNRRTHKGMRRCQKVTYTEGNSIDLRPVIVETKQRYGDWEGDSVESIAHKPGINTILERKSGYVCIAKLNAKTAEATANTVIQRMIIFPPYLRRTLTLDHGPENTDWKMIEKQVGIDCFFAHPYHSWERGSNENINGLIRDYFPKGTDFTKIPEAELAFVESELNIRPRKRLGYRTPLQVMSVALQS